MGESLQVYQNRLEAWKLDQFPGQTPGDISQKFGPDGVAKPYYGLTIVAFIEPSSVLYQNLCDYQTRIKRALTSAGLDSHFTFLEPGSFHMTLCDIVAGPLPLSAEHIDGAVNIAAKLFPELEGYGELACQYSDLGLDMSLMQLADFDSERSLLQCLHLERALKQGFGVNERSFLGHISLAYLLGYSKEALKQILKSLSPFSKEILGEFKMNKLSLCYFSDMNTYEDLVSIDLLDGYLENFWKNSNHGVNHA